MRNLALQRFQSVWTLIVSGQMPFSETLESAFAAGVVDADDEELSFLSELPQPGSGTRVFCAARFQSLPPRRVFRPSRAPHSNSTRRPPNNSWSGFTSNDRNA